MIGLGLGIGISQSLGFNIASIFANGENGAWLEPWDQSTMFQDSAGTPVTDYGQGVALRLDKSKGLVLGPELIANGGFDTDTDWTKGTGWSIAGGLSVKVSGTAASIEQSGRSFEANCWYQIEFDVSGFSGTGSITPTIAGVQTNTGPALTGDGHKKCFILSTAANTIARFTADSGLNCAIDNITVKKIAGNHAYQSTATARAIYGRVPATGKNNILKNSVWAGGGAVPTDWTQPTATGTSAVAGTINGNTIYRHTASAQRPYFLYGSTLSLGTSGAITTSLYVETVHSGSLNVAQLINYQSLPTGSTVQYAINGINCLTSDIVSDGDRISCTLTSGGTAGTPSIRIGAGCTVGVTVDISISRPMVNTGSTALNYQNSVSDYDTTEDGVPTLYGLKYDKLDDGYIFPSMTFTLPVTTIRGQRHVSNVNAPWIFFFNSADANDGWWEAAQDGNNTSYKGAAVGTPATYVNGTLVNPATRNALYDATLDANTIVTTKNLTLGTVSLKVGTYPSPYQFGGWEFGFVICEGMTDEEIAATEAYFNQHTGAY
jgi:hypothetical protein